MQKNVGKYLLLKRIVTCILLLTFSLLIHAQAPCTYLPGIGCSGANYNNYGAASDNNAETIEYDNYVSTFHSSIIREYTGDFRIWGEKTSAAAANQNSTVVINRSSYPNLTGRLLKASMGSNSTSANQVTMLTTTGLFVWGTPGGVISTSIVNANFQKVNMAGSDYGLPAGVAPTDVKMLFATYQTLAILTCNGNVYVLSQTGNMRGITATGNSTTWYQVQQNDGANLSNVAVLRGSPGAMIALKNDGTVWTWGPSSWLGNDANGVLSRSRATAMILPSGESSAIKMIGVTGSTAMSSYYLLYTNGKLYTVGENSNRELGDWTTTDKSAWVQPRYTSASGPLMNDIVWISPNEHDNALGATINVTNSSGNLFNWGRNDQSSLGRGLSVTNVNPGTPGGLTDRIRAVETGGHTTMVSRSCTSNYGYVGHKINGSVGDGTSGTDNINTFSYATAYVQICGATTVPQINTVSTPVFGANGLICGTSSVELSPFPAGGTLVVTSGPATLNGTTLNFTGVGQVLISYTVNVSECGAPVVATRTFATESCTLYKITGSLWNDDNGNAIKDPGETNTAQGLWANLIAPNGLVVSSVKVNTDGTYTLSTPGIMAGSYSIILTNTENYFDKPVSTADVPVGGYGYTGTNLNNTANRSNRTGILIIGELTGASLNNANFGISNNPAALPVIFGSVAATMQNGNISVKWSTLKEYNNAHFEIEASADGKTFSAIGSVNTIATNGNSDMELNYVFMRDVNGSLLGIGILTLLAGLGLLMSGERSRKTFGIGCMVIVSGIVIGSCSNKNTISANTGKLMIRIVQVDKDGSRSYSKTITATAE